MTDDAVMTVRGKPCICSFCGEPIREKHRRNGGWEAHSGPNLGAEDTRWYHNLCGVAVARGVQCPKCEVLQEWVVRLFALLEDIDESGYQTHDTTEALRQLRQLRWLQPQQKSRSRSLGGVMENVFIPVRVSRGVFKSERCVSWQVNGKSYETIVDESDVVGNKLRVSVIEANGDEVLIQLPRECWVTGSRLTVPRSFLIVE